MARTFRTFRPSNLDFSELQTHSPSQILNQRVDQYNCGRHYRLPQFHIPSESSISFGDKDCMKTIPLFRFVLAGMIILLFSSLSFAGDLLSLMGRGSDCGCNRPAPFLGHFGRVGQQFPSIHLSPLAHSGCACSVAASSCCGMGGGLAQIGGLYGADSIYGAHESSSFSGPASGSFLSGYEGLPNMDGGGVHQRYPYHSYRRPWAHPGPSSTNVTIVW